MLQNSCKGALMLTMPVLHRWGVTGGSFVVTALLSETICARRELRDIPLGLSPSDQCFSAYAEDIFSHQALSCFAASVTTHTHTMHEDFEQQLHTNHGCFCAVNAGTTAHRRAPQAELTPLNTGGQAAGRTSPAPKGLAAVQSVIERVVNKADSGRGASSAGSRHADEQV